MNYKTLLFLLFATCTTSFGQSWQGKSNARNTIYAELGGQSLLYSLSYDRLINIQENRKTSINGGIGVEHTSRRSSLGVPLSYNFLFGRGSHHFEAGLGLSVNYHKIHAYTISTFNEGANHVTDKYLSSFVIPKVGYRYQQPEGGLFFRAAFTPPIIVHEHYFVFDSRQTSNRKDAFLWGGISLGYSF